MRQGGKPRRLDNMTRLAMFEAWKERCIWCHRPLFFDQMEVEHVLPKSLPSRASHSSLGRG
jgi:hypothetical protein